MQNIQHQAIAQPIQNIDIVVIPENDVTEPETETQSQSQIKDKQLQDQKIELEKSSQYQKQKQYKKVLCFSYWLKIIVGLALLTTGTCLFLFSIKKNCPEEEYPNKQDCVDLLAQEISKWLKIYPVIILCIQPVTILGYYKFFDRYRIMMYVSLILQIVLCFCIYDLDMSQSDERDYSSTQALVLIVCLLLSYIVIFVIRTFYYIYMKFPYFCLLIVLSIVGLIVWFVIEINKSCDNWDLGINGKIINNDQYAVINNPSICWPDFLGDFLDLSKGSCDIDNEYKYQAEVLYQYDIINKKEYEKLQKNKSKLKEKVKENQYLAWPKTNTFTDEQRYPENIQQEMIKNTKTYDNYDTAYQSGESEIVIDLEQLDVNIKIQKDQELINQRKNQSIQIDSLADTVIVVYIDTLSRAQMHRKMKKSMEFLRNLNNNQQQNQQSFEFYRYHSLDKQTLNNNLVLHFDRKYQEVYDNIEVLDNNLENNNSENQQIPNLMKSFKKKGHIVAHSSNTCTSQCSFRNEHSEIRKYFSEEPADHEFLFYDPMYVNKDNYFDVTKGPNSFKRRCAYEQDTAKLIFDYGTQFLNTYKGEKKVLYLEFTDAHEITSEVVKYMDDHLYNFLVSAQENGHLDSKSMIYLFADHGQHMLPSFYMTDRTDLDDMWDDKDDFTTDVYAMERMLPLFQMIVSKDILQKQDIQQNLNNNQQITIGMRDIRSSLLASIEDENKVINSVNIFQQLQENRDCRDIDMMNFLHQSQYCIARPNE